MPGDLGGVWRVQVAARATSDVFLCRVLPAFTESFLDTVATAGSVAELLAAVVPDSLREVFDQVCVVESRDGDAWAQCAFSAALVSTCSLTVRFGLIARQAGADSVHGRGRGIGLLHGACPNASCPGSITLDLERLTPAGSR
jgi:hypothetical protein